MNGEWSIKELDPAVRGSYPPIEGGEEGVECELPKLENGEIVNPDAELKVKLQNQFLFRYWFKDEIFKNQTALIFLENPFSWTNFTKAQQVIERTRHPGVS